MTHRPDPIAQPGRLFPWLTRALPLALFVFAAPAQAQVVISQVYGGGGNAGATLRNDFIELFNRGAAPVNVGGWSVQYTSTTGTTWSVSAITAGRTIAPGGYFLLQQAQGAGGTQNLPTPDEIGALALSGTNGKVALSNTSSALSGNAPSGGPVVDIVSYGPASTPTEGTPTAVLSNTTAALRNGAGCDDTGNNSLDFTIGAPNPRNSTVAAIVCGGGGGGGGAAVARATYDIQGEGATSPFVGQNVITSGVVTLLANGGFFIQAPTGDGNPRTSDGLFIFANPALWPGVQVGNLVQVTGTVSEFSFGAGATATPLTQLTAVSAVSLLGSGFIVTPTVVALPLMPGLSFEFFEGMLVTLQGAMQVQQNFLQARFGQVTLGAGRHQTPTNLHRPNSAQASALAELQARSRLLLDDASSAQNPNPTPFVLPGGVLRAGDGVGNLTGVLDFGPATNSLAVPGLYRLQATVAPTFTALNPRPAGLRGMGNDKIKVASMNVLNFFTTFTNGQTAFGGTGQGCTVGTSTTAGNCRGASNTEEYLRQRDKIVRAIAGLNADVIGLMEIQNNDNVAVQALVDALNSQARVGPYAALALPSQGTGTDAIRVAMIYRPLRVTPQGVPLSDAAAINNRPTLAQAFAGPNGQRFSVVVNHFKSKGSCPGAGDPDAPGNLDIGDGQGCWNGTRVRQAQQLRSFVASVQAASASPDVLLIGDLNAYGQEDPIFDLTSNGFVDQAARFNPEAYSYVFDGQAGRLDHAISSATLSPKIVGTAIWHINADESVAYDYNLEFKQPACPTCAPDPANRFDPYRSSDHDPVVVTIDLNAAPPTRAATAPARMPAAGAK